MKPKILMILSDILWKVGLHQFSLRCYINARLMQQ
jgi:hypothetical protein